jgi:hypothetical protein
LRILLPGYTRLAAPGSAGIALESCRSVLESILASETLYDFAARQPGARRFSGRAPVYGVDLPDGCGAAVVRRSMRGGILARVNTDLFLPPTRSLRELVTSLRLRSAGVPTPEMIGFAVYRSGLILRRSDVVTRELKGGADLASILTTGESGEHRAASLDAAAHLVADLSRAGAHHPDLNLRNILIAPSDTGDATPARAYILDVDRIRFHIPGDPVVLGANIARLARSMRKWRDLHALVIDDSEIETLRARVLELAQ